MKKPKICANGAVRYSGSGQMAAIRKPCQRPARPGHIHCEPCRLEAGGYARKKAA